MYSKMQGRGGFGGNGLWLCAPCSSNTMISPGSMSRTYFAPMMSSAQVSDARIGQPPPPRARRAHNPPPLPDPPAPPADAADPLHHKYREPPHVLTHPVTPPA